ncbi:MAG: hypothetical protein ACFFC7_02130 [Candidatus Hermodarchaeota archaeon]
MSKSEKADVPSVDAMKLLLGLQKSMDIVLKSLDTLNVRVEAIEKQIMQDAEPKEDYLKQTVDAIESLIEEKDGIPLSKTELATFMGLSESTIYFRCEKLVETKQITKFYGRDLGFEPAKSVFYAIPRTLYDLQSVESITNELARKVALALLQSQPLGKKDFLMAETLSEDELEEGITYLLNRGLIARKSKADGSIFYLITQD